MKTRLFSLGFAYIKYSAHLHTSLCKKRTNTCDTCLRSNWDTYNSRYNRISYPFLENPDSTVCTTVIYPQKKWPDVLFADTEVGIYSENVVSALENAEITCFRKLPVLFFDVPKKKTPDRKYYAVFPNTIVNEDVIETEFTKPFICSQCGRFNSHAFVLKYHTTKIFFETRLRESDYHGEDFVFVRHFGTDNSIYCSEKVVDLCCQKKWTNFVITDYSHPHIPDGITIRHDQPNWRELLEQDIAQKEAELRGESTHPIQISVPEVTPPTPAPKLASDHPFDNLSGFDGSMWQGTTKLPCAFGLCEIIVYEDEDADFDESDDPLPTPGQRRLFDFFVASQNTLLPTLQETLLYALKKFGISIPTLNSFSVLAQWLDASDLEIRKTSTKGCGNVSLLYSIKNTTKSIFITWSCTPSRGSIQIESASLQNE